MAREASNLVEKEIMQADYDVLVPGGTTVIETVSVEPGQEKVVRGQVLVEGTNKLYKKAKTSDIAAGKKLVIAHDEVDTGNEAAGVAAVINAIISGVVIRDNVKVADGELSAEHEQVLRTQSINLTSMLHADGKASKVTNRI